MKRLILSGIPCVPEAWHKIFPVEKNVQQKIIPFIDIFTKGFYKNKKLSDLVPLVCDIIQDFLPDQIIMHDMGVTVGILSLISILKKTRGLQCDMVIFNGAFGYFDVNKSNHPIRIQNMSYADFEYEVRKNGGEIDPKYRDHYVAVQQFYQELVEINKLYAIKRNIEDLSESSKLVNSRSQIDLGGKVLIIASRNDPYIYFECLESLKSIILNSYMKIIDYGHFPYSGSVELIKNEIKKFSNNLE